MNLSCLIIDDEPLAIEVIKAHIRKLGGIDVKGTARDGISAFHLLQAQAVDLIFLDIEMPDLDGLSLLRSLSRRPEVILTTAYRDYALEGYEHDIVDYLLKPISFPRFLKAVEKVRRRQQTSAPLPGVPASTAPEALIVRTDRQHRIVPLQAIRYIESMRDYAKIVTDTETLICKRTLTGLMDELPESEFIRIHRSFIVGKRHLKTVAADHVMLEDVKHSFPIGRRFRDSARERLSVGVV